MKIVTAQSAGFCFGVRRAVEAVRAELAAGGRVWTYGEIIHNPRVVSELAAAGVRVAQSPQDVGPEDTVVIRSHGVPLEVQRALEARAGRVVDATCPYVAKIHRIVAAAGERVVVIAGDASHPEVQGIVGHCAGENYVVADVSELDALFSRLENLPKLELLFAAQTTYNTQQWGKILKNIKKACTNASVFDTICRATVIRQTEAEQLARSADGMVVVGGAHSSNTRKLCDICEQYCPTVLVEDASGLDPYRGMLSGMNTVGLTAGASTPVCIIKEVQYSMSTLDNINNEMSFEEMLDQSFKTTYNGERTTGIVTGIKPTEIEVDIGTKQAGYVPLSELTDDPTKKPEDLVKIGDSIELLAVRVNDVEGTVMLSKRRLDAAAGLEKVMNAGETGEILTGKVAEAIKGGVLVQSNGVKVFVPASQSGVPRDGDLNSIVGQAVEFKIIDTNRQRRRAVGSISLVAREKRKELADKFWETVEVGKVYTGKVKSLTNFGVFVDLGGVDGRISLSDLTWLRVKHPSEVVSIGDTVTVTVKDIDRENGKVSLIYKKSEDNPWEIIAKTYKVGDVVRVRIMSTTAFGAFAQIIPGIDGLIHISQIARERVEKVTDKLNVGDEVEALITELDYEKKRASLSIKALLPDTNAAPAEPAAEAAEAPEAQPAEEKE